VLVGHVGAVGNEGLEQSPLACAARKLAEPWGQVERKGLEILK